MKYTGKLFISFLLLSLVLNAAAGNDSEKLKKLHDLNRDIVLLNLINGLYLTAEQTESLLQKGKEAEAIRNRFAKSLESHTQEFGDVLNELRIVLLSEKEIPDNLKVRIHEMKMIQHKIEDEQGEGLTGLETEILGMLTENQRIVIETYKPCTIPPAQGKIGQSAVAAANGLARLLTRCRQLSQIDFDNMKAMFVENHIDRIEKHEGRLTAEEKTALTQKMIDVLETARTLSDQDYIVRKSSLANSLLFSKNKAERRLKKYQLGKTGLFMLDPALMPILEQRQR